jgi:hypothetical protein
MATNIDTSHPPDDDKSPLLSKLLSFKGYENE